MVLSALHKGLGSGKPRRRHRLPLLTSLLLCLCCLCAVALGGLAAEEDLSETVKESARKRLPWLVILLGLGNVVSSVVGMLENVVAQLTIVVCFQSLVLDMAGNVGTQSLAVTIRVLMDEKLSGLQKLSLIWKETKVGFINGILLALLSLGMIGLYTWIFKGKDLFFAFAVAGCVGAALLLSMTLAAFAGTVIPVFLKKINTYNKIYLIHKIKILFFSP